MLKIYLCRHGETEANIANRYQGSSDYPLADKGREQAESLKQSLAGIRFHKVFSSDLIRAKQTAEIAAGHSDIIEIPEIRERHYGIWEDVHGGTIRDKWPELYKLWLTKPGEAEIPEAETIATMKARIVKGMQRIEEQHDFKSDENFLVVCHGGANRYILSHYMGLDLNEFWKLRQDNCCINIIEVKKNYRSISLINYTPGIIHGIGQEQY